MIHQLISALLKDLVGFLKEHPDFLKKSGDDKAKHPAMKWLMKDISTDDQLLDAIQGAVNALKGSGMSTKNPILNGIGHYLTVDFPALFDQLGKEFHASSRPEQIKQLKDLMPEQAAFYDVLKAEMLVASPQELSETIVSFLQDFYQTPRVVVQSPTECSRALKQEIRTHFYEQHPQSFVQFSVNPQLIGGIRFFVDGKVVDHSWFARIQDIRKLHQLVS